MKRSLLVLVSLAAPLFLARCTEAGREAPDFGDVTQVDSARAVGMVMSAYRTTMLANGEDEALIRTFVVDSLGRQIMSAENLMQVRYDLPVNVVEYGQFAPEIHEIVFGLPDGLGNGTATWEPLGGFFDRETGTPTERLRMYDDLAARYLGTE